MGNWTVRKPLFSGLQGMKLLLSLFLSVTALCLNAQVVPRNLLATRYSAEAVRTALLPRAEWTPYPRTPDAWQKALPDTLRQSLIREGEQAAKQPIPALPATMALEFVRTTNRSHYEAASFARRNLLMDLVVAESVEGKGRFMDPIVDLVWAICEESAWGIPAHLGVQKTGNGLPNTDDRTVDLFGAETGAIMALTDYLVGDKLAKISPLIRPRIYRETNERLLTPIQQANRYGWLKPTAKVNNWNPWIMANWLTATLLLEPNADRRSQMTYAAMQGLDIYLNGLGENGGCDEGPSYWFAAGACVFDALDLLHSASNGKLNVYREPLIRNMASYVYKMHIDHAYFVDFADADPTLKPDGLMLYRFGKQISDDTLTRFGQWAYQTFHVSESTSNTHRTQGFHRQRQLQNLLAIPQMVPPATPFVGVRNVWFPDVQVMTARSDKLYLATHAGHNNESHNHNDVGDFILYVNGKPVIIDAGRGTYTGKTFSGKRYTDLWWTQSHYHNLPTVNGLAQPAGRQYEAQAVKYVPTANGAALSMDLAKAYPTGAGIKNWNRTVALDRRRETVSVTDEYALAAPPSSLQQSFMTTCTADIATPGRVLLTMPTALSGTAKPSTVVLQYDPKRWSVTVEPIALTMPDDEGFKAKWPNQTIQRILLTGINPAATGKVVFGFSVQQ